MGVEADGGDKALPFWNSSAAEIMGQTLYTILLL